MRKAPKPSRRLHGLPRPRSCFASRDIKTLAAAFLVTCLALGSLSMVRAAEVGDWLDARGEPLTERAAVKRIGAADVVLLGEVHDSADIHRRQVALLETFPGHPLVLALEQLDLEYWDALVSEQSSNEGIDARSLAEIGGFDEEGWGWDQYGPLCELAVKNGWPVRPLNLSRQKAMAIAMAEEDWLEPLSSEQQKVLESRAPELALPEALQGDLLDTLIGAHCKDMGRDLARRIARAQVARDVLMADAIVRMREAFPERRVVAIMGNQHARLDRGVGYWLEQMSGIPDEIVVSIAMVPVNSAPLGNEVGVYHLRLLTDRVDRPSSCAGNTNVDKN